MKTRRSLATVLGIILVAPLLPLGVTPAHAGGTATCFGSPTLGDPRNVVMGTDQSETLIGTPAADIIIGRRGRDTIRGLGGADLICGSEDSDPPDAGDKIYGGPGFEIISGGQGDDSIFGGRDRDNLFGGGGSDTLNGGANEPGVGDDANYFFASGPIEANLRTGIARGEGRDKLVNVEGLGGSPDNDRLLGNREDNSFDGLGGDDIMRGRFGVDTLGMTFANGPTFVNLRGGTSVGDGSDTFSQIENAFGGPDDDYITGSGSDNVILGGTGNDTIYGRQGNDILMGFDGADSIFAGAGVVDFVPYSDRPDLAVDINLLTGEVQRDDGNDTLEGVEMVEGSSMNDQITGDHGPNFFYADQGNDDIDGNGGSDLIFYLDALNRVVVDLAKGTANEVGGGQDTLAEVENVVGSGYDDTLFGNTGRNFLNGSDGADQVHARKGNDYVAGGSGNDTLVGGAGRNDLVDFFQSRRPVTVTLARAKTATGEGTDTLASIESVSGTGTGDSVRGSRRPNFLYGVGGRDKMFGGAGDDRLGGGQGRDSLTGGADNDKCHTKRESSSCERFGPPDAHPVAEVGRRYKKAVAAARRYKRRYK